jgi:hypothetical protein
MVQLLTSAWNVPEMGRADDAPLPHAPLWLLERLALRSIAFEHSASCVGLCLEVQHACLCYSRVFLTFFMACTAYITAFVSCMLHGSPDTQASAGPSSLTSSVPCLKPHAALYTSLHCSRQLLVLA